MGPAGVEVALNVRPITKRNFAWGFGLQFATNRSRVLDLAGVQFVPFPISGGNNGLTGIQAVAMGGPSRDRRRDRLHPLRAGSLLYFGVDLDNTAGECAGAPAGARTLPSSTAIPNLTLPGTT